MRKRIFVAVDISEEARRKVADYIETLRSKFPNLEVGWDKPEKLHLTLKFIGDMSDAKVGNLCAIVEKIAFQISDFRLKIEKTGVFPSTQKARVLWIDVVDEQGSLTEINRLLETELEKIGFVREKREFKPHLTIARLRREPQLSGDLVKTHMENEFEPVEIKVCEIVIYESKLYLTGSVYSKLKRFKMSEPH